MSASFEQRLPEIAQFVREKLPDCSKWPEGRLEEWLRWFWARGWLCVITREGAVAGIGAARPVREGQEADRYAADDAGDTAWVDIAVATDPTITRGLWEAMLCRIGRRNFLGYHRAARDDQPCVFPFDKFAERILP